jgi:phage/plasmid-associated DNA primase
MLPDREWNWNAAQLAFKIKEDKDNLSYPTWLKVLEHCGRGLDEGVQQDAWCKAHDIQTGAHYLKCWVASMFKFPREPLPYLFFYGDQNCGKSIFHEALTLLMKRGVERADNALISQSGFNGELQNAVLCVVEETDLRKNKQAYERIKDWVTGRQLPVHAKGKQPYTVINTTHWVQCANSHLACPVFAGDTRIVMIEVPPLSPENLIPKRQLLEMLQKEAADFITACFALELPQSNDRLNIPVVTTSAKEKAQGDNLTPLETYIKECCHVVLGATIKYSDFYEGFKKSCDPTQESSWSQIRVGRELPPLHPKGRLTRDKGQFHVANLSLTKDVKPTTRLVLKDGYLVTQYANGDGTHETVEAS